jgi:transposase
MEVNPVLIKEYKKSTTLRRTKTDSVDCESIAWWLMTVEYKPHSKGFYHAYSLKSLTRLRDRLIRQRSFYLVKITNVLDHTFPEFKPFFNERLSKRRFKTSKDCSDLSPISFVSSADKIKRALTY